MPEKKRNVRKRLSWDEWYKLAKRYKDRFGSLLVPRDYICPGGERLGRWIEKQRARYNDVSSADRRLYDEEIALLEQIGMVWKLENRLNWADWLKVLDRYRSAHGDINVPKDFSQDGFGLGDWIVKQRTAHAEGRLSAAQIADLEARGMVWRAGARRRHWDDWYQDAKSYFERHGDLMVPPDYITPEGRRLGTWIYRQRDIHMGRKANLRLTPEQVKRLESIHMVWEPQRLKRETWESMYACIAEYRKAHGKLPVWPRDLKAPDGRSFPGWIRTQRTALAKGDLPRERVERLAAIGIVAPKPVQDAAALQ